MKIVPYCPSEGEKKLGCAQAGCEVCLEKLVKEYAGLICAVVHAQNAWKADFGDLIQEVGSDYGKQSEALTHNKGRVSRVTPGLLSVIGCGML